MKINFSASGTYGDAYTTVCKLYSLSKSINIHIDHHVCEPVGYLPVLKEIYSVLPSVDIEVVDAKDKYKYPLIQSYPPGAKMLDGSIAKEADKSKQGSFAFKPPTIFRNTS